MPLNIDTAIDRALRNVATHGDTDVFPFPFENHLFFDKKAEAADLLKKIHNNFDDYFAKDTPQAVQALTQVGYTGFRWASFIEPFWNAYYLALVISVADDLELERIAPEEKRVFSYRVKWADAESTLFADSTWLDFRRHALAESATSKYVVVTDIADFYPRVYHHPLDNALRRLPSSGDVPFRTMKLLSAFSKGASYGLPIGGPASRMLSELALSASDLHLHRRKIRFCRYADDYCLFCDDRSQAYGALVLLSEKLFNEGLVLQKNKTRIYSAEEFREISKMLDPKDINDPSASEEEKLLSVSIRFDPYSPTADEEYEHIKNAIAQIDILGILGRELAKTELDQTVTKQAISAIRALEPQDRDGAVKTLLDPQNLQVLSPVFVTLMRTLRSLYAELEESTKGFVDKTLLELFDRGDPLLRVDVNLSYCLQVLALRRTVAKEELLIRLFEQTTNPLIRRSIIIAMGSWRVYYWLSDQKKKYHQLSLWERRALILCSYVLGDEGDHWRKQSRATWSEFELLVRDWFAERWSKNQSIPT